MNSKKAIVLIILASLIISFVAKNNNSSASQIQKGIAEKIIRFHCLANSDSEADQELKIKVKDKVVLYLQKLLKDSKSIEESRDIILKNITYIKVLAKDTISENGYSYDVSISLANTFFPTKMYGDMIFPAGEYEALRIQIGESEGKNWWCVLFPTLCFIDSTLSIVPDESKEKLQNILTIDEYNALINGKAKIKVKFKLLEFLGIN